jgi:enamine deaminase RidA (YjgF/YER057c/UK114 family)
MAPPSSTTLNPASVPAPQPQFSQVNTITFSAPTKLIACTGQLAIHPSDPTKPPPADFNDQVRLALQNLENCLKAAGATKRHIFKVTHYVVGFDFEKQNPAAVFCEWMDKGDDADWAGAGKGESGRGHRPASAMLPTVRLAGEGWLYEIECWAVVPLGE